MSEQQSAKPYPGQQVTVSFDAGRCLHAAECVKGLPEVFDTGRRPWISPDGAAADQVAEVVRRCPSGALQYRLASGEAEQPAHPTRITRSPGGRLVVRGELLLNTADGPRAETRVVLCGCALSADQPYCDHSGPCAGEPFS